MEGPPEVVTFTLTTLHRAGLTTAIDVCVLEVIIPTLLPKYTDLVFDKLTSVIVMDIPPVIEP